MPCYACGTPFEADAHWGDCWLAQLHGGFRHEAKQLLTQWADKLTAQEETINAQAARLAAQQPVMDAAVAWVDGLGAYGQTKKRWDALIAAVYAYHQQATGAVGAGEPNRG